MKRRDRTSFAAVRAFAATLLLSGCAASTPQTAPEPATIAVLELPPTVSDASLQRVLHGHEQMDQAAFAADRLRVNAALQRALGDMAPCATSGNGFAGTIGLSLASDELAEIRAQRPADAYLRVEVTDYGETPRRWRGAYVAFEAVTTLGIAAGLALQSQSIAGAYLVEESVEETSEGYAGFWTLDRLSRPIRIDADLVDGRDGLVVWQAARTGMASWSWRNLLHMNDQRRDALLDASMRRAIAEVTTDAAGHARMQFECTPGK